jgi:hypothetical protein
MEASDNIMVIYLQYWLVIVLYYFRYNARKSSKILEKISQTCILKGLY